MWKEGARNKLSGSAVKTDFRLFRGGEQGTTLIEVLVALAILGAVAVVFLLGLTTSSKAVMVSQNRVVAESLAKSQMESIKSQGYDDVHNPPEYVKLTGITANYDILISAQRWDPVTDAPSTDDTKLQNITVTVTHDGGAVLTLVDYRVNR